LHKRTGISKSFSHTFTGCSGISGTGLSFSVSILLFSIYLHRFSLVIPAEIPALNQDKSCSNIVILRSSEADSSSDLHKKSGYPSGKGVTAP
jgi:hypothetical protein